MKAGPRYSSHRAPDTLWGLVLSPPQPGTIRGCPLWPLCGRGPWTPLTVPKCSRRSGGHVADSEPSAGLFFSLVLTGAICPLCLLFFIVLRHT